MLGHAPQHPHHHRRFYILLTTVIVGALLILMLMNDKDGLSFLTGSSIGVDGEDILGEEEEVIFEDLDVGNGMEFVLHFDAVPEVEEESTLKLVRLSFGDLSTKIKINSEELELKGLDEVEMEIEEFNGEIDFDEISLTLKGEGEKIVVNGMEISTKGMMEISFSNLVYETLEVEGIMIGSFETDDGRGEMLVGEKMTYDLDYESIKGSGFMGDLSVGLDNASLLVMEGEISGINVDGEFDLTLG